MSKPKLGEQTEQFWEDFDKIEGVQVICDLWDKAFNCWVIEDIAQVLIKHGIVSPPVKWIEITDDPATWPLVDTWVLAKDRPKGEEFLLYRKENGKEYYHTKVCRFAVEQQGESFTHWRPIW